MEFDSIIVGGGPAGLTAAIYLGRYHLSVLIIDDGKSRAEMIPLSRNLPGFAQGINGSELLDRMRKQADLYGVSYKQKTVMSLRREEESFALNTKDSKFAAATVLLATGVVNRRPDMPREIHDTGLKRGLIRYCPICDGYELTDQPIGVLGRDLHAINEAEFLRSYSANVTLIAPDARPLEETLRLRMKQLGIKFAEGPCEFTLKTDLINISTPTGMYQFSALYPALGSYVRSDLAIDLKASRSENGCLIVDRQQSTSIEGLYAAGDVVLGLDQISSAMGQGSIAATAIRNRIAQNRAILR